MKGKRTIFILSICLGLLITSFSLYLLNQTIDNKQISDILFVCIYGAIILMATCLITSIIRHYSYNRSLNEKIHQLDCYTREKEMYLQQEKDTETKDFCQPISVAQNFRNEIKKQHPHFINILHQKVPDITEGEELLCIFIRLNIKNRVIAQILHVDNNTVYTSRSRLKHKLPLPDGELMDDWIQKLG